MTQYSFYEELGTTAFDYNTLLFVFEKARQDRLLSNEMFEEWLNRVPLELLPYAVDLVNVVIAAMPDQRFTQRNIEYLAYNMHRIVQEDIRAGRLVAVP